MAAACGSFQVDHLIRITVHDDVGVVRCDNDLPPSLEPLEGGQHRSKQEPVVQLIFGLIDYQGTTVICLQRTRESNTLTRWPPERSSSRR